MLKIWINSEKGSTAIEYGLIAAGISIGISGVVFAFGDVLYEFFYASLPDLLDNGGGE